MLAILPVLALAVAAPNPDVMKLDVRDAHVAPRAAGGSVGVSMLITNPTSSTLILVGATSPLAGETALQRYVKDAQGLIQVAPVNSLPLPAHSDTVLAPGAVELQLIGLTTELQAGLELPLTLKFADGTKRVLRVEVEGDDHE